MSVHAGQVGPAVRAARVFELEPGHRLHAHESPSRPPALTEDCQPGVVPLTVSTAVLLVSCIVYAAIALYVYAHYW